MDISESPNTRKCTGCRQPVKGHAGPVGIKCPQRQRRPSEDDDAENHIPSPDTGAEAGDPSISQVFSTLVSEMRTLNITLTKVVLNQEELKSMISVSGPATPNHVSRPDPNIPGSSADIHDSPVLAAQISSLSRQQAVDGLVLANGAKISRTTKADALDGKFVDLNEFLPSISPNNEMDTIIVDGTIRVKPKKTKNAIDCFDKWLTAWSGYEGLLMSARCEKELYRSLNAYRLFIQNCDKKYMWQAISVYDIRHRSQLGDNQDLGIDKTDIDLFVTILDSSSLKPNAIKCHRCKSYDHVVTLCPFPEEATKTPKKKTMYKKWFHNRVEGCNNFNRGVCYASDCKRAHVCEGC